MEVRIFIFRKLKFKLTRKHLETIYFSFNWPLMEYSDVIWDNVADTLKIGWKVAQIVMGRTKFTSRQLLLAKSKWENLQTRINQKLIKFHEKFHNHYPEHLSSLVRSKQFDLHKDRTRNASILQTVCCRTSFYQGCFYHQWFSNGIAYQVRYITMPLSLTS